MSVGPRIDPVSRQSRRRPLVAILLAAVLSACTSSVPTTTTPAVATPGLSSGAPSDSVQPSSSPQPPGAQRWVAAHVEEGDVVTGAPSDAAVHCSPCHPLAATLLFGVTAFHDRFVATGVQEPPPEPALWTSFDGMDWTRAASMTGPQGSVGVAATADAGRVVVVGRNNAGATSWSSPDGSTWNSAPPSAQLAGPAGATKMTSVTAWNGGFVAGGFSDDPSAGTIDAAIWTSDDGLRWTRVRAAVDAVFRDAHVLAMATNGSRLVAVGTTQDETRGTAVAWWSDDGRTWERAAAGGLTAGIMRGVTTLPGGFAAVGLRAADDGAISWTSTDGLAWTPVTDQPGFHFATSPVRMLAVTATQGGIAAVGWRSDAGNGSAVVWTSPDGRTWTQEPFLPTFSGASMSGVVTGPNGQVIAVGTSGYPDNDQAQIWVRRP